MLLTNNSFTSTCSVLAISFNVLRSGCIVFWHHLLTVLGVLPSASAGHLPVLFNPNEFYAIEICHNIATDSNLVQRYQNFMKVTSVIKGKLHTILLILVKLGKMACKAFTFRLVCSQPFTKGQTLMTSIRYPFPCNLQIPKSENCHCNLR